MSGNQTSDVEKQEPKENDKCMDSTPNDRDEDNKWRNRLNEFGKRTKDFTSDHHKLVILLLCILLFVFLIIIIVLAASLGKSKTEERVYCTSQQCFSAASDLVSKLNDSIDPCDDFFAYSCSKWIDDKSNYYKRGLGSLDVLNEVREKVYWQIRHLIDLVPHETDSHSPYGKLKLFYSTCMDEPNIKSRSIHTLKDKISEIGGWEVLNYPLRSSWNRDTVLSNVHAQYRVNSFFRISVGADNRNPTRNIIKISPDGLGLPGKRYYDGPMNSKYLKAYKIFISDIIVELEGRPSDANTVADRVCGLETRIAEMFPIPERSLNDDENYKVVTIQNLTTISPIIKWIEILEECYPNFPISKDTEVAILYEDYFRLLSGLLSTTDNLSLNNYLMWRFVFQNLPHLPESYRIIANKFYQIFEGGVSDAITVPPEDRWEFCVGQAINYFGYSVSSLYVQKYFESESKPDVNKIVNHVLLSILEDSNSFSWLRSSEDREKVQEKIQTMTIQIGYPNFIMDKAALESFYYKYLLKNTNYLGNIENGDKFIRQKEEELLQNPINEDHSWTIYPVEQITKYMYAGNRLLIPAGLLNSPIYECGYPNAVKYGSLAAHVINKLVQVLDARGIFYKRHGNLDPWLTNSSRVAYNETYDCLLKYVTDYIYEDPKLHSNLTVTQLINDIGGIKFAYEAYKNKAKKNDGLLPGIDKNYDQLFFISYAQSLCQVPQPDKVIEWNDKYPIPNRLRVLGSLQQSPEFRKAFNCPANSNMYPQKQCSIL